VRWIDYRIDQQDKNFVEAKQARMVGRPRSYIAFRDHGSSGAIILHWGEPSGPRPLNRAHFYDICGYDPGGVDG
jgi:hypothetical protein